MKLKFHFSAFLTYKPRRDSAADTLAVKHVTELAL